MAGDFRRVLVRAPNPLGDAVMALPAMAAVRAAFRDRTLIVAAARPIAPLFHEITSAAPDTVIAVDKATEASALRAVEADVEILLTNSFRTAWAARRAGIPERWGYRAHGRALLLTRSIPRPRGRRHQSDYYRHLVRALGIEPVDSLPGVDITKETRERVDRLFDDLRLDRRTPIVGIAPGAAYGHAKRWPADRFAALIARLTAAGMTPVMVGAEADRDAGREIESLLPSGVRAVSLIGRTDLRLLAGLLAACHGFVSNDSGAMHLAAAAGVPVTAIFGPTDERATAPLGDHDVIIHNVFCRPCMLRDCPIDHRCMRGIGVDAVFDATSRRVAARTAAGTERQR